MNQPFEIAPGIYLGPAPAPAEYASLAGRGIRTVVDFRHPSEHDGTCEEAARAAGLRYVNIPVTRDAFADAVVDAFRATLGEQPKPLYTHCATGVRAGAMLLMALAVERGWTPRHALDEASRLGFDCDAHPQIKAFFVDYITRHSQPAAAQAASSQREA